MGMFKGTANVQTLFPFPKGQYSWLILSITYPYFWCYFVVKGIILYMCFSFFPSLPSLFILLFSPLLSFCYSHCQTLIESKHIRSMILFRKGSMQPLSYCFEISFDFC